MKDASLGVLKKGPYWLALALFGGLLAWLMTGTWFYIPDPNFRLDLMSQCRFAASSLVWWAASRDPEPPPPRLRDIGLMVVLGNVISPWTWHDPIVGCGIAGLTLLTWRALRARGEKRTRLFGYLSLAGFFPLYPGFVGLLFALIARLSPQVYDLRAMQLDGLVGFQPAFWALRQLQQHPWLESVLAAVYDIQLLMMVLAILLALQHPQRVYFDPWRATVTAGVVGVMLYSLYPAAGTGFACRELGWGFPPLKDPLFPNGQIPPLLAASPDQWRNCTPSLHTAWALILLFTLSRYSLPTKTIALLYTVLTIASTLTRGHHWWNDLISSFPLTIGALALSTFPTQRNGPVRVVCACAGGGLAIGWIALQRWGHRLLLTAPALTLTAQAMLVFGSLLAERWLAKTSQSPP